MKTLAPLALLLCAASACSNPKGTCIVEDQKDPSAAKCAVNKAKNACAKKQPECAFYEEDDVAGVARCKAAGFITSTDRSDVAAALKNHELVVFYRDH